MSGMPLFVAAKKIGISEDKLKAWEAGEESPTIKQLRKLASTYKQSFAAFFLQEPPTVPKLPLKDYRRLPGATSHELPYEITMDVRNAIDRRLMILDLAALNGMSLKGFHYRGEISEGVERLSKRIRNDLGVSMEEQMSLRDPRIGLNFWRERLEKAGVLVFQSSTIGLSDMRGYSIFEETLPIIVVNRKDTESARIFTLMHELVHLYLRGSGLCDLDPRTDIPPEEQYLEQFCNEVAANTLVPSEDLNKHQLVKYNDGVWLDEHIANLSRDYCVSREMLVRRLVQTGRASNEFYREKRDQYSEEWERVKAKKKPGFVPPSTDVISKAGKVFSGLVMQSLRSRKINSTQASEMLGVKLKHLRKISAQLGG